MTNILKPLAKRLLIPLGLKVATSAIDAGIQEKSFRSVTTTPIVSNEEMEDMKIVEIF